MLRGAAPRHAHPSSSQGAPPSPSRTPLLPSSAPGDSGSPLYVLQDGSVWRHNTHASWCVRALLARSPGVCSSREVAIARAGRTTLGSRLMPPAGQLNRRGRHGQSGIRSRCRSRRTHIPCLGTRRPRPSGSHTGTASIRRCRRPVQGPGRPRAPRPPVSPSLSRTPRPAGPVESRIASYARRGTCHSKI